MTFFLHKVGPANPSPGPGPLTRRRKLVFTALVVLIVLAAVELGLTVLYVIRDSIPPYVREALQVSPYAGLDWPTKCFAEEVSTKNQFVPFVMWRRQEFHGKYVNISPDGLRKTWNSLEVPDREAKKVFCFGGSTTWGVGARDDFTIPSLLAKKLNQDTARFAVQNCGEKGYCLTQEIFYLLLLLKQGKVPDYVIFYDGVNEVLVGYKNKKPGSILGADHMRRQLFQKETRWQYLGKIWQQSGIYRGWNDLSTLIKSYFKKPEEVSPDEEKVLDQLAASVVADYLKNLELVRGLSQVYGFKYLFIWQPALLTNRALTEEEKRLPAWDNKKMVKLYELVYERMRNVKMDNFYNISDMFDHKKNTVFISWAHITETGNEQVAQRIFQIFREKFRWASLVKPGGV